jgi:hypothetical protein
VNALDEFRVALEAIVGEVRQDGPTAAISERLVTLVEVPVAGARLLAHALYRGIQTGII